MARYIDLSDKAKGQVQRRAMAKVNWEAELNRLANEAEKVKTMPMRSEARRQRMLVELRRDYAAAKRAKHFVDTGINLQHVDKA